MSSISQQRLTYEEISQLNQRKDELKAQHQGYLDEHTEIPRMLSDFMSAVLLDKPEDVFLFAAEHFGTFEGSDGGFRPVVISGPKSVGKTTVIGMLVKKFPEAFGFCVSHTTRGAREGETDGVNYSFISKDVFKNMVEQKQFIENGDVAGDSYGTSIEAVNAVRKTGKRMRGRGAESEETLKANLKDASIDIKYGTANGNFHKVIVNDDIEETFHEVRDTLVSWFPHLEKLEAEDDD
eukprot:g2581.t1